MLRTKAPQSSFYGSYLYDRIVPEDHLPMKINTVVDFSYVTGLVADRYSKFTGCPTEDPEVYTTALSVSVASGLPLLPSP